MKTIIYLTIFFSLTFSDISGQTKNPTYKKLSDTAFIDNDIIIIPGIRFILGKCEFFKNAKDSINPIADFIKKHPAFKIEIGVHTVVRGKKDTNLVLTQCRATKILDYLTKELMLPSDNFVVKGYGDTQPIYSKKYLDNLIYQPSYNEKKLEEFHEKNKRVEIKIIKTN